MTVKDVIRECLAKMGKPNYVDQATLTSDEEKVVDDLLKAINIMYRQIVSQYLPLIEREQVVFENGVLLSSSLEKSILYPIRITKNGEKKRFRVLFNKIECGFSGVAEIEYAYMPQGEFEIDDDIVDMRISQCTLVAGVLGEYYFENKVFDLANNFDSEFRSQISTLKYKGRPMRIKARGWED